MQKVAVVGSRMFDDYPFMVKVLSRFRQSFGDFVVVSGGAPGADSLSERWSREEAGQEPVVLRAEWDNFNLPEPWTNKRRVRNGKAYNPVAGFFRNQQIVDTIDQFVVAFTDPDAQTPGTKDTIHRARIAGKTVFIVWPGKKAVTLRGK